MFPYKLMVTASSHFSLRKFHRNDLLLDNGGICIYTMENYSAIKRKNSNTCYNIDESRKHNGKLKNKSHKRTHTV